MTVAISVSFIRGTFDASSVRDNARHEWPPHPARLFNALVDTAANTGQLETVKDALRWLETQPAPQIILSTSNAKQSERVAYVPTNQHVSKSADVWKTNYPGRVSKGPRSWPRTIAGDRVLFVWDDGTAHEWDELEKLLFDIPYFGRATTPVVVELLRTFEIRPNDVEYLPSEALGHLELSVPRQGYLDALIAAFDRGQSAHEVPRRWVSYQAKHPDSDIHRSAYHQPVVLPLQQPQDPRFVVALTGKLRASLESILDPSPPVLNGHSPGGGSGAVRHQVGLVGLPSCFGHYADGLVRGLAVLFPRDADGTDVDRIESALARIRELRFGSGERIQLGGRSSSLVSLNARIWTRAAKEWVTVTPMVSNRYLKPTDEVGWTEQVLTACHHAELPRPTDIDLSSVPFAVGALVAPRYDTRRPLPKDVAKAAQRRSEKSKPAMHVRIRFENKVQGPIVLGNLRHYGLGLCMPLRRIDKNEVHDAEY
jgi:CRISPR-associated protein Csb2